jgi:hypothetical protein
LRRDVNDLAKISRIGVGSQTIQSLDGRRHESTRPGASPALSS